MMMIDHTIVSREIIKPSFPTTSHLKTYNLSVIDQIMPNIFMPMVTFYPNTRTGIYGDKTLVLDHMKNSLSQTLTKYYPFAGMHAKVAPSYVDCNDNGAEFLEASIDTTLTDFLQHPQQHEGLDQLFPHGLVYYKSNRVDDHQSDNVTPLEIQVNHFECGGVAVAVSLSHKIADGSSLIRFMNDWGKMTRSICSKDQKHDLSIEIDVNPRFIPFQHMKINPMEYSAATTDDCVTKSFLFPSSKLNELKQKVKAMTAETRQLNLTRVEVLTWLLYKCAVAAATKNNLGAFKPTGVRQLKNLRNRMMEKLPEETVGNFALPMEVLTNKESEMGPTLVIGEMKKQRMQFQALKNMEALFGSIDFKEELTRSAKVYTFTSLCGYPTYEIDFGWGKPLKATLAGNLLKNSFLLLDTPNKNGIEVLVCLEKHDMAILETDPQLLAFA